MNEDTRGNLQREIEEIAAASSATAVAVALHDCESDFTFFIDGDRPFHAASTMKVAVLLATLRAVDEGRLRLDDALHIRNRFLSVIDQSPYRLDATSDGVPELYRAIGCTKKISELAESMIVASSNLATNLLLDFIGVTFTRRVLEEAGVRGMELHRGVEDTRAHEAGVNNETTARGLLALFGALRSDFLSKPMRERAIQILLQQRFNSMIPAGLPAHATVAHKTGEISTACHDAGIVYLPEREPYLLAILTEVPAESNGRKETVAAISKAIYGAVMGGAGDVK
jgi:beta-lactamase class A